MAKCTLASLTRHCVDEGVVSLVVIIINLIIVSSRLAHHSFLVDEFEEKSGEDGTGVGENEEHIDLIGVVEVALEELSNGDTESGSRVEGRASEDCTQDRVTNETCVSCSDDQGGNSRVS